MDIDEEGGMLLSGHKDGSVALWDLGTNQYKILKHIPNLHSSEITCVKINRVSPNGD